MPTCIFELTLGRVFRSTIITIDIAHRIILRLPIIVSSFLDVREYGEDEPRSFTKARYYFYYIHT